MIVATRGEISAGRDGAPRRSEPDRAGGGVGGVANPVTKNTGRVVASRVLSGVPVGEFKKHPLPAIFLAMYLEFTFFITSY